MNINNYNCRPPLKWPGGKFKLCNKIIPALPQGKVLVEPFVGAGAIFLNSEYKYYILNDINTDLIELYKHLQKDHNKIISSASKLFKPRYNEKSKYYKLRDKFNLSEDPFERSFLFIYLNRHGYNGLCRYNASGGYNVPFGAYKLPYFPHNELEYFAKKAKRAEFHNSDFEPIVDNAPRNSVVYCDPPYVPLSFSANFTSYSGNKFCVVEQERLSNAIIKAQKRMVKTVLSNHNTVFTRKLYSCATLHKFKVRRNISCNGKKRKHAPELLAIFSD